MEQQVIRAWEGLVSWCFKPSQPQRIISGLRKTFIKRYIVERTSKAEVRPVEQSEKADSCRENFWNEIQFQTKQDRMRIFEEILFFKATYDTKTNKSLIFCPLDSCGRKRARD